MSKRDKEAREGAHGEGTQAGMMRLFGQMLLFPFTVFVFSIELFARTIRELQRTADEGMNLLAGDAGPPPAGISTGEEHSTDPRISGVLQSQTIAGTDDDTVQVAVPLTDKEIVMRDKDLNDDQLKLVRYKILFVKRDYETAFPEREDLVPDNMTGDAFAAWKVAEFIQRLSDKRTHIPSDWVKADDNLKYPEETKYAEKADGSWVLLGLPEKDKKYLRVYYEVLERYVREEDEDDQVDMLREIRNTLRGGITVFTRESEDSSTGSSTGGGAGTGSGPASGGPASGGAGSGAGGGGAAGSAGGGRGYNP
jgi:hypothetical protein